MPLRSGGSLDKGAAPAVGIDLLAGKERAVGIAFTGLELTQRTARASLRRGMVGEFLFIDSRGVFDIPQRRGLRIFLVQMGLGTRQRGGTRGADGPRSQDEDSTLAIHRSLSRWFQ